jgi:uncharacterized protein (TIGR02246 family)
MTTTMRTLALAGTVLAAAAIISRAPAQPGDAARLAARVQVLEDREEIRALIMAYGEAHDARDYRRFADLFAETDGEWVGGLGTARGRSAIFALMDETIGHNPQPGGSGTYHVMTNDQIAIDGDRASAVTKWIYLTPNESNNPQMLFLGHYEDQFIRENGEWKFLRREAPVDIAPPQP